GGRSHPEPEDPLRSPFERDRHRVMESTAFRRLEGKTQVFAPSHHDHFRTRLTHTLEAAQIARCLAAALRANELLAEAITWAHDLGHPPFGHAGEAALNEAMAGCGGFNHNTHALRVVDYLEHPFPAFRGLNLTAETRAGLLTHATHYDTPASTTDRSDTLEARAAGGMESRSIGSPRGQSDVKVPPHRHLSHNDPPTRPSVEAQIASIADRIAYNCHDLEDAIGAEFVGLTALSHTALWQDAYEDIATNDDARHIHAIRRIVLDKMLDTLLTDVIETSRRRLASIGSLEQARATDEPLVTPSADADARLNELERFLIKHVYRHPEVAAMDAKGRQMVLALFDAYRTDRGALPKRFAARIDEQGIDRVTCDYIAGMTDRFCTTEHGRLARS
ncbi:MAG: dNTP triphosphohydrolase, partial [Phycisphaerales bacterium]